MNRGTDFIHTVPVGVALCFYRKCSVSYSLLFGITITSVFSTNTGFSASQAWSDSMDPKWLIMNTHKNIRSLFKDLVKGI